MEFNRRCLALLACSACLLALTAFGFLSSETGRVHEPAPASPRFLQAADGSEAVATSRNRLTVWTVIQAIFAVIYYFKVVKDYPDLKDHEERVPTDRSKDIQNKLPPCAVCDASGINCALSFCCIQARAAHTMEKTDTLHYGMGVVAMFCCMCPTLCFVNACTEMNEKLGGEKTSLIQSCCCTWGCGCCLTAQDAESLDDVMGVQTGCCGVSGDGMME